MCPPQPTGEPTPDTVVRAFLDFLDRRAAGEEVEIETLLEEHPEDASELRRIHEDWNRAEELLPSFSAGSRSVLREVLLRHGSESDPSVSLSEEPADPSTLEQIVQRLEEHGASYGRYRLKGELARGGMGAVLRVWDDDLRRETALKVMLGKGAPKRTGKTPAVDSRSLGRFLEEAQITGQLEHPGIVPVHELGIDDRGRVFFTMRLVRGLTFREAFQKARDGEDGWTFARAVDAMLRASEAVAYAHSKGVVHRDLKPSNVMVGRFGETYVMDWGLARVLGREDLKDIRIVDPGESGDVQTALEGEKHGTPGSPLATRDGDVVGTPSYMSPEQARGDLDEIGPATDVYSLGAMLYELLTGRAPFCPTGSTAPAEVWRRVKRGPPTPILDLAPGASPELVAIAEKAMQRRVQDRYADVSELADELRAYLELRVVRAYRTGPIVRLEKWVRRNPATAAAVFGVLVTLVVGGLALARSERRRLNERVTHLEQELAVSLIQRADSLWPIDPDRTPELDAWLVDARRVVRHEEITEAELADFQSRADGEAQVPDGRAVREGERQLDSLRNRREGMIDLLATLRSELRELEAQPDSAENEARVRERRRDLAILEREIPRLAELTERIEAAQRLQRAWRYTDPQLEADYARQWRLVSSLRRLLGDGPGSIADIERRRDLSASLRARTVTDQRRAWESAIASIADVDECPAYEGRTIVPQVGLVPLRRDPSSQLWEFWHVLSGDRPALADDGEYVIEPQTGVVLVLVPGTDAFVMGAQGDDPTAPNYCAPDHARSSASDEATFAVPPDEGPVHEVALAPYFLSKYELTQAQWYRLTGSLPSKRWPGLSQKANPRVSASAPVEQVSWAEALDGLRRWGLTLPTEAQWERAARAGSDTPYWSGATFETLLGSVNFADERIEVARFKRSHLVAYDDGYGHHAPVDAFPANGFGFCSILGNVAEWCLDDFAKPDENGSYALEGIDPRTGEHRPQLHATKPYRGGSFANAPTDLRASSRMDRTPSGKSPDLGVRACRALKEDP